MADKRIRIILDANKAKSDAKSLDNSLRDTGKSADRAQFSMNKLAAAIAAVISVQKVTQYADAWGRVQNQLVRTTTSAENLAATSQTLLSIANDTRSSLEATVELYTSLSVATQSLGVSQERAIGVTETINNLFLESGKGAQESAGAIRQLGQALQSGALRGDEFNSVAEGAPGILRAIELQTGKTRGELRELAAQGGITAELIVASLESYSEAAQEAADKTSVTLEQAFTVAGNNLTYFVGQLDDATGASSSFASAIIDMSNYVSSPAFISGLLQAFQTASLTIDMASDSVADFSNELQLVSDTGSGALAFLGDAFKNLLPNIRSLVQIVTVELASGIDKLRISATTLFEIFSNPFDSGRVDAAMQSYNYQIDAINSARMDSLGVIIQERDAIISTAAETAKLRIEEANRRKEARANRVAPTAGALTGGGISGSATTSDVGQKELAQAQNITRQLQNELNLRLQIADIYRQQTLAADGSFYEQQLAAIEARESEELARVQAKAIEDQIRRTEQFRQALENEKIQEEERRILKEEQANQEILAEQILQSEIVSIREQGKKAREDLDRAEFNSRLANAGALGNALISLGQGQSKKIFKIGKTLALAQAAVALPTAVMESFKNGGGYPWGLIPAGLMLATGLKNIQQIKSAGAGLGGGGGGSVPTPSLPSGGAGGSPSIPSTANTQEPQQRRIIEIRGMSPGDLLTGDQVASLFESNDNVIVAFENAREDAQRRNVIGVTAR